MAVKESIALAKAAIENKNDELAFSILIGTYAKSGKLML